MFREVESHFAHVATVDMPRSMFGRPKRHLTSFNFGELIPIYCEPIYPGDTVKMTTNKVVRLQTLLTPVLDNAYLDTYWFYIPMRLVFSRTKEFFGENTASAWIPQVTYQIPSISAPSGGFAVGTIADHLEWPVGVNWNSTDKNAPMALPLRCYALIANEFFRDTNLTDPLNIPLGDSNQTGSNGSSYINDVANGGMPFKVAKYHDYFTSALPGPQRGNPVKFPLISGTMAPVGTRSSSTNSYISSSFNNYALSWHAGTNQSFTDKAWYNIGAYGHNSGGTDVGYGSTYGSTISAPSGTINLMPSNLWADLSDTVGAVTVNQLRLAFQLQKYYERLSLAGDRYTSTLKSMFGVTAPDASLQRPEYLGGNRIALTVNEVTNTAQSATDFLGDLGGMSRTVDSHYEFVKSFSEFGFLCCVVCARYSHTYSQGIAPWLLRKTQETWYNPIFANIGEQPIMKCSIYADGNMNNDSVFGYQEAWADLRYSIDAVTGELRPGIANSLASWHFADYYTQAPTLSDAWIREDKTNVDRTLAVTSTNANQVFGDFYFDATYTRVMPMYSIPGLIDHH